MIKIGIICQQYFMLSSIDIDKSIFLNSFFQKLLNNYQLFIKM